MAEVTYYYNTRASTSWTDSDYMIDGILTNYAYTSFNGAMCAVVQTTCPGTNLGTITKVEVRVYGYGDGNDRIDLSFGYPTREPEYLLTIPTSSNWSEWIDVTGDPNIGGWTWAIVKDSYGEVSKRLWVEKDTVAKGNPMYCSKVEIRVTYTPSGGTYYHGLKVQGVGELALTDLGNHPLRIRKGGITYGIELVATDDPNASALRIKTGVGIKAIRKYT